MPDVLEAPIVAKTFDDGYGPASAGRSHFRLGGLSLSPWTWSLGSSMSGGVEVSARGGLRLASTHSPYVVEEGTTPASLLHRHHPHHLQHQRTASRYYPHLHPLSSNQQHSSSQLGGSHHQRQHLSNLENLSHRRPVPLHLLHPSRHAGKSAAAATRGRCVPLTAADPTMRANERWVLLNKETFQEIFDATLHQMTYAPGELLSGGGADDRKSSTSSSSDHDAEDGAESPPSPTTPEGLRCQRAAPALCSRKRTLSDVAAEQEEAEAARSSFWRASPLTAMAPTESAKTTTSALNDITNDRPGQRYSPAISSSAGSSTPTSPRLTSPGAVLTSSHSPQGTVVPSNPDRENNEPLDLSNKRSPATDTAGDRMNSDSDSSNAEWSPSPSPKCSSNNNNNGAHFDRALSPPTPSPAPTGYVAEGSRAGLRQGSPGLAPPSSTTTTTTTVTDPDPQTQPAPPRTPPAAAELRQKASPEGGPVRANGSSAPVDPRAPSPRGTEAGGGGSRAGVVAGAGRRGEEDARGGGGTPTTTTHPALAGGGESSSSSSSSHHHTTSVGGRGAGGGGGSSSTASTATATVSSVPTTEGASCSSRITPTQTTCNNTTIAATTASIDTHPTCQQTAPSHRDTKSPNSLTPHTSTSKTIPDGGSGVSRMIADTSGDPAAATVATSSGKTTTTSVTSRQVTASGQVMKHASENWMLLNKATVYDLVEEVMYSLGEDEEEGKVSALRDSSNHRRTMSPGDVGSTPLQQHQQQQSQQSKSSRTAATTNNNNNNNALKRTHAEMDGGHTGRRHRCSPPLPLERCVHQSQAQEDRMERADDNNSSSRSAAGSLRPAVSTTKSQLRDHLSARSQQGRVPPSSSTSSRVPNHSDPAPRERLQLQQQQQLSRCSPVRSTCLPPGDYSSSSTSPTSKTKQQQCWVALNKNLVYNIVDSAMRNSETEEEDEEEMEKNAPSDPRLNGHGADGSRVGLGGAESDSNSNSSSEGESDNSNRRSNPNPKSTSHFDTQSQQVNGSKKRPCDNIPSCVTTGAALEEGEYVAKRSRVAAPSPPVRCDPASPLRTSVMEGPSEGIAPSMGVSGPGRTCLEGLLSESSGRRTPPTPERHQPHKATAGEAPTSTSAAAAASDDGGLKVRKSVHLVDCQPSRIDHAQSAASHPQKADGNVAARSPSSATPCGASSKNQSSSHRVNNGSNQVRGATTATGRAAVSRDQVKVLTTSGSGDDVTSHTKHGLVPLPASKHGLVPVSPSPTDARSSPRLGWVAVSKVDVHNIVDSVVDSMIAGDPMTSSSSPPPPEVDTRSNSRSPVPSPPSSSMSPPHHISSVTSPVPARDAESSHRASSPLCPSLTVGPRSPHQQEPERRGRGTPSPVMASPGSPRSPCDVLDRCSDSKAATKAFKWKSSLLMRVEEEKIDVTPEVATTSGRSASPRVGGKPASKSESRSLRSGKRGSRKGGSSSTSKLK